jgi:hypothetical protein
VTAWRGWWAALLLMMTLASGCTSVRHISSVETLPQPEVLNRVAARNGQIISLRAGGSITLESPENSSSGSFDLFLKKPDSLRMEFHGPFGIHVGTLSLSRDTFCFYNWYEKSFVSGKPTEETLFQVFRIRMGFDDILKAFTGEFPAPAGIPAAPMGHSAENGEYLLRYTGTKGNTEYRIDGEKFLVTSYRRTDTSGLPVLIAHASDITGDGEPPMPRLLRIVFPRESRSMTVSYDEFDINTPVICAFTRPTQSGRSGQ